VVCRIRAQLGHGKIPFSGALTPTISDSTADFSMPMVRRGRGQALEHAGGAWNLIWSPVEEESDPTWLLTVAQLRPEGGTGEGSMRRLFTRLEMPVRCARWGGSPRLHRCGPEQSARNEVLTEVDGDGIGSLQGVAWRPAARCQATMRGVKVGDDGAAPVMLVEVVCRQ
jgi:hypothetical protein